MLLVRCYGFCFECGLVGHVNEIAATFLEGPLKAPPKQRVDQALVLSLSVCGAQVADPGSLFQGVDAGAFGAARPCSDTGDVVRGDEFRYAEMIGSYIAIVVITGLLIEVPVAVGGPLMSAFLGMRGFVGHLWNCSCAYCGGGLTADAATWFKDLHDGKSIAIVTIIGCSFISITIAGYMAVIIAFGMYMRHHGYGLYVKHCLNIWVARFTRVDMDGKGTGIWGREGKFSSMFGISGGHVLNAEGGQCMNEFYVTAHMVADGYPTGLGCCRGGPPLGNFCPWRPRPWASASRRARPTSPSPLRRRPPSRAGPPPLPTAERGGGTAMTRTFTPRNAEPGVGSATPNAGPGAPRDRARTRAGRSPEGAQKAEATERGPPPAAPSSLPCTCTCS